MSDASIHDYLPRVRRLAAGLVGSRLVAVRRLTNLEQAEPPRLQDGRALLEREAGAGWLANVDEGLSNLLLWEASGELLANALARDPIQPVIAPAGPDDPLSFMIGQTITSVEEISRPSPPDWTQILFEVCGLRLTFAGGAQVCVGTHLTDLMVPGVWFLLPDEVDPELRYRPLAGPGG